MVFVSCAGLFATSAFGQVDISSLATSSMVALKVSGTSTPLSDANTASQLSVGVTAASALTYNIVGDTGGNNAFSIAATNDISNLAENGTASGGGVIFRLWLGADATSFLASNTIGAVVGIGPAQSPAKATFGIMALLSNSGSSGGLYLVQGNPADKAPELISKLGTTTTSIVTGLNPLTDTKLLSYKVISSGSFNGATDTSDALLTFAVPFSAINVATGTTAPNSSVAFGVNNYWNFTAGVYTGVTVASGTTTRGGTAPFDVFAADTSNSTGLNFSGSVTANGTLTTGTFNVQADVPEESTVVLLPAFLGPVAGIAFWRRRAAKRAAQAKAAAAN